MSHFWHFNDHSSGSKHDNQKIDLIFLIYSPSSTCWYILFLYFKILKLQFHDVPPFHYVMVCKTHTYILKMTFSSLLTQISFFYVKFNNFWCITSIVSYLIPIWPRSHGLSFSVAFMLSNIESVAFHYFQYFCISL